MLLKLEYDSNCNVTQIRMSLLFKCHSNWNADFKKTNSMNSAEFNLFFCFSVKLVDFSAKFGFFDVQVRINFRNVILIPCKWCKICKYYVNGMVISCSTLSCCNVKFVVLFCHICIPKIAGFTKKVFFQVCWNVTEIGRSLKFEYHSRWKTR